MRYYLLSAKEYAESLASGTTFLELSAKRMSALEIPLPPVPEQRRIVRKLDTLSARSTTARTHLTAIEKLVERYKDAVLKSAFNGSLTNAWRVEHGVTQSAANETLAQAEREKLKLKSDQGEMRKARTTQSDGHRLPVEVEFPAEWKLVTMEHVTSPVRLIQYGILKPGEDVEGGVPYVKVMNIKRGYVELDKIRRTTRAIHQQYLRSSLQKGDLLLTIRGTVGRLAFVPEALDGGNITQDTVRIDVLKSVNSVFLFWYLHSPQAQKYFQENQKGVAVRGINVGDVRPMEVPLPGNDEQNEIVRRIETAFAKIDRLKAEAAKALKLLGHLDQRILAKAFAGDLVPQDPTDEPAETLLARIREARAAAPTVKRRRAAIAGRPS